MIRIAGGNLFPESITLHNGTKYYVIGGNRLSRSILLNQIAYGLNDNIRQYIRHPILIDGITIGQFINCPNKYTFAEVSILMKGIGFDDYTFDTLNRMIGSLSDNLNIKLQMIRALCIVPEILLIDSVLFDNLEPGAALWLAKILKLYKGTIVFVTQDSVIANGIANYVIEINGTHLTYHRGNYKDYETNYNIWYVREISAIDKKIHNIIAMRLMYKIPPPHMPRRLYRLPNTSLANLPRAQLSHILIHDCSVEHDGVVLRNINVNMYGNDKIIIVGNDEYKKKLLLYLVEGTISPNIGCISHKILGNILQYPLFISFEERSMKLLNYFISKCDSRDVSEDIIGVFNLNELSDQYLYMLSDSQYARVQLASLIISKSPLIILDNPTEYLDLNLSISLLKMLVAYNGIVIVNTNNLNYISCGFFKIIDTTADPVTTITTDKFLRRY